MSCVKRMGDKRNIYNILVRKNEGKRPLEILGLIRKESIDPQ